MALTHTALASHPEIAPKFRAACVSPARGGAAADLDFAIVTDVIGLVPAVRQACARARQHSELNNPTIGEHTKATESL